MAKKKSKTKVKKTAKKKVAKKKKKATSDFKEDLYRMNELKDKKLTTALKKKIIKLKRDRMKIASIAKKCKVTKEQVSQVVRDAKEPKVVQSVGLQAKRLEVMRAIPLVRCSVISKDPQGLQYAHTQAEDIYQDYRKEMVKRFLTITLINCNTESVLVHKKSDGTELYSSRAHCTFRIRDIESGEYEDIQASALGNNDVWSDNSAQTVAMKQALLQYFFAAWPQPTDYVEVVRASLNELPPKDFRDAMTQMMPQKILSNAGAMKALEEFYDAALKK